MSRVFLAEEPRLGRQVVIKLLPPDMGAAVNVERFEREIQLAARLQHPHIVPLLTAGAQGDLLYYIMPYIAGESLRARLGRDGAFPVPEAVKILREAVDALAYAHKNGVVHRDIKPDNVLLSTGHAVVTDFGVAKAVSASSGSGSLTSLGVALGTPAYMAPEQAAADPNVDHRADIYSLGALAYEMLTGRTPFTAPTPQMLLAAHITQTPDPLTKHRPAVPAALNAVIMRCLEKHPADRWQTAAELLAQLEVVLTPSGGMTPTNALPAVSSGTEEALRKSHPVRVAILALVGAIVTAGIAFAAVRAFGLPDWVFYGAVILLALGLPIILLTGHFERTRAEARATGRIVPPTTAGMHRVFTWQKAKHGGFLAFGGLALVAGIYTAMRLLGIGPVGTLVASGKLDNQSQVIVADFENRTPDSTLGGSVTEAFRIDLGQSKVVRVLASAAVSGALERMQKSPGAPVTLAVAREIAAREGAKAVIAGEISSVGKSYVLVARVVNAADGNELVALRETAPDDGGIVEALDRLSGKVRERIGESLKSIRATTPLEKVTASSLEALRLYTEASRLNDTRNADSAVVLLRQTVALDTGFAMAWRKLAVAIANTGGSASEVIDAATRAYQHRDRLPTVERELATAYYHATVDIDGEQEAAAYRRILADDPKNFIALNNLSQYLNGVGQHVEAESLASEATAEQGSNSQWWHLVMAQTGQGHFADARKTLAALERTFGPKDGILLQSRGLYFTLTGEADSAERAWAALGLAARAPGDQAVVAIGMGSVVLDHGRLAEADRRMQAFSALQMRRGLPGSALGIELTRADLRAFYQQDPAGAADIVAQSLRQHPLDSMPLHDRPYAQLVRSYVRTGNLPEAKRFLADFEKTVPGSRRQGMPGWYLAKAAVALADKKPAEAVTQLRLMRTKGRRADWGFYEEGLAWDQLNQPDSAIAAYARAGSDAGGWNRLFDTPWSKAPALKRLGELYEARGDKSNAIAAYTRFVDLWRDADPPLQPSVREAKERLAKLSGEPKP